MYESTPQFLCPDMHPSSFFIRSDRIMLCFIHRIDPLPYGCMKLSRSQAPSVSPELLARVSKGDADAFGQLYDQTSQLLFTLALRILNNREDAAELLQDVYVEVWRKADRFDSQRGSPMAWLITLTRSRAIDRLRAATSRGRNATDSIDDSPIGALRSGMPDPLEQHAVEELRSLVVEAFTDLPAAQQEAIELAFYEGLTHTEIAARLNKPVGTIKTRIKLGMNKLRYTLRPCWELK
jgi:RNA polymerase sigma-70 factor, ECF subfamily